MQVYGVQNNNNYKTNFGAKLKIKGSHITKELYEVLSKKAAQIGNDSDTVTLRVGRKYPFTWEWGQPGQMRESTDYFRTNHVISNIAGETKKEKFISYAGTDEEVDKRCLEIKILKYFEDLITKNSKKA